MAAAYRNIAVVNLSQGEERQGFEILTKAYDINLKVMGPDHPSTRQLKSFLGK